MVLFCEFFSPLNQPLTTLPASNSKVVFEYTGGLFQRALETLTEKSTAKLESDRDAAPAALDFGALFRHRTNPWWLVTASN